MEASSLVELKTVVMLSPLTDKIILGILPSSAITWSRETASVLPTISLILTGLYFSTWKGIGDQILKIWPAGEQDGNKCLIILAIIIQEIATYPWERKCSFRCWCWRFIDIHGCHCAAVGFAREWSNQKFKWSLRVWNLLSRYMGP